MIGIGLVGVVLAALCCATPVLAVLLPAAGLGAWLAGAYWVLPLLLFVGLGVIAFGLVRRRVRTDGYCETLITKNRG
ncbi:MAG: mercury transport protein [Alphaproteobacteria bacterium]|nr:mercury transport protein [Alphaproteobacteria bacterium]